MALNNENNKNNNDSLSNLLSLYLNTSIKKNNNQITLGEIINQNGGKHGIVKIYGGDTYISSCRLLLEYIKSKTNSNYKSGSKNNEYDHYFVKKINKKEFETYLINKIAKKTEISENLSPYMNHIFKKVEDQYSPEFAKNVIENLQKFRDEDNGYDTDALCDDLTETDHSNSDYFASDIFKSRFKDKYTKEDLMKCMSDASSSYKPQ